MQFLSASKSSQWPSFTLLRTLAHHCAARVRLVAAGGTAFDSGLVQRPVTHLKARNTIGAFTDTVRSDVVSKQRRVGSKLVLITIRPCTQ